MLIIILYVLTTNLYTDHKCLYQKIYISKNGDTPYIKNNYCNNVYLIVSYKSKCAHLLYIQFPMVQYFGAQSLLVLFSIKLHLLLVIKNQKEKIFLHFRLYQNCPLLINLAQVFWTLTVKLRLKTTLQTIQEHIQKEI